MEKFLKDVTKLEKTDIKNRTLTCQVNHEKRINEFLKNLKSASSRIRKLKQLDLELMFYMA